MGRNAMWAAAALAGAAMAAAPAAAQERRVVGAGGFQVGLIGIDELNPPGSQDATVFFGLVEGTLAVPAGRDFTLTFDAVGRSHDYAADAFFDTPEGPRSDYTVGLHLLYDFGRGTRAGLFVAYGDTFSQGGPRADDYDVALLGLEGQALLAENVMIFGQIGIGDKVRDGQDPSQGYRVGDFFRFGLDYFHDERTSFTAGFEMARADYYVNGARGEFYNWDVGVARRLPVDAPLYGTFGFEYNFTGSTGNGTQIGDLSINAGLTYTFGTDDLREVRLAGAGVGVPRAPTRASAWTAFLD